MYGRVPIDSAASTCNRFSIVDDILNTLHETGTRKLDDSVVARAKHAQNAPLRVAHRLRKQLVCND